MVGFAGAQVDVLYEGCNFYQNLKVHFKFFPIFHIYEVELLDVVELHFFKQLLDACEQSIGYKRTTGIFKNLLDIFLILVYHLNIKELLLSQLVEFQQTIAVFLGGVTGNTLVIELKVIGVVELVGNLTEEQIDKDIKRMFEIGDCMISQYRCKLMVYRAYLCMRQPLQIIYRIFEFSNRIGLDVVFKKAFGLE